MAGLGLTNAVALYNQGLDGYNRRERQAKDEAFQDSQRARLEQQQGLEDTQRALELEAQQVGQQTYKDAMGGFQQAAGPSLGELNTAPGLQAPAVDATHQREWNKRAVLKSLDARSDFFAGKGDMQGFMKNEAAAMPYRAEVRSAAIDRALVGYKATKDPIALAKTVHEFIFDGRDITDAKQDGDKLTFTLSDGSKQVMTPDEVLQTAQYMRDPKAAAEYEAKTRWELTKARIETEAKNTQADHKGKVDAGLETVKHGNAVALEGVRGRNELQQIGARTTGDIKVAEARGAQDRLTKQVKPAKSAEDKRLRSDALQRMVINSGVGVIDPVTQQARGNADSNKVTFRAEQYMDANPEMTEAEAVMHAVNEFKQRAQ